MSVSWHYGWFSIAVTFPLLQTMFDQRKPTVNHLNHIQKIHYYGNCSHVYFLMKSEHQRVINVNVFSNTHTNLNNNNNVNYTPSLCVISDWITHLKAPFRFRNWSNIPTQRTYIYTYSVCDVIQLLLLHEMRFSEWNRAPYIGPYIYLFDKVGWLPDRYSFVNIFLNHLLYFGLIKVQYMMKAMWHFAWFYRFILASGLGRLQLDLQDAWMIVMNLYNYTMSAGLALILQIGSMSNTFHVRRKSKHLKCELF